MRVLILAGIHGNLPAFEAVLEDAKGKWDTIWCLGNVVGFGPQPNECIELLKTLPHQGVTGAFECVILGYYHADWFDELPGTSTPTIATQWTRTILTPENIQYLKTFPTSSVAGQYTLLSSKPGSRLWDYFYEEFGAALTFSYFETLYCFSGNISMSKFFELQNDGNAIMREVRNNQPFILNEQRKIIMPGCVGISGIEIPQYANYGLLDTDNAVFEYCRCLYNLEDLLHRLRVANLSERLIMSWKKGWL